MSLNAADHRLLAREGFEDYDWSFPDVNRELGNALRSKRQSRTVSWIGAGVVVVSAIIVQQQLNVADGSFALGYAAFFTGAGAVVFTPTFSILKSRQAKRYARQAEKLRKAQMQSYR